MNYLGSSPMPKPANDRNKDARALSALIVRPGLSYSV